MSRPRGAQHDHKTNLLSRCQAYRVYIILFAIERNKINAFMNSKAPDTHPAAGQYKHGTLLLIITSIATFISPFNTSAINIALPDIGNEFAADAVTLSWVATAFLLATAVFLVPLGKLADIYGMKKMMMSGLVVYVVSAAAAALSASMPLLISARAAQGLASAMIFSTSTAILVINNPIEKRGHVLGINVATVYAALSLGPFLGGILTQTLGWRSMFWLLAMISLAALIMTAWLIKGEWAGARGEKFDLPGSLIYGAGLVAMIWGFAELPEWQGFAAIGASAVILTAFVIWELKASSSVLSIRLFIQNRVFGLSNLAAMINYAATFAVTFLLSLYLQYVKNLAPTDAGLIILVMPILQAIFSPITGKLSDKIETRWLVSGGMGLTMAGLVLLIFLNSDTHISYIITSLVILGLGFALFSSPNTNAIMSSVEHKSLSIASATLATMRVIGQMLSMGIATLVIAVIIGHVQITPEYYVNFVSSVRVSFIVFSVLCFGGIFASLARGNTRAV
jgi:EmrB/QacA subfamily drug resistance transporter